MKDSSGWEQFVALVRHFFGRFFDNEFVAQNTEMQATVTKLLALLAAPGIILPCERMTTYLRLDGLPWAAWQPTLWFDRSFFLCFSMLVMGGVTVLDPHVTGQCVLELDETAATAMRDQLTEWLG